MSGQKDDRVIGTTQAPPPPLIYTPPQNALAILHQNDDFLIVDKPSGLLSVPGKGPELKDCLESRVQNLLPSARIVHRLDMDTSGIMVLACNANAHRHIGLQFERRHVEKTYQAQIWGRLLQDQGKITLPLRCDWPNRPKQMVDHDQGKSAKTCWKVLQRTARSTHVELYPQTGRSHQLRVHMLSLGHPILGDNLYAHPEALAASKRLHLHATSLSLFHPSGGERLTFQSPCPF